MSDDHANLRNDLKELRAEFLTVLRESFDLIRRDFRDDIQEVKNQYANFVLKIHFDTTVQGFEKTLERQARDIDDLKDHNRWLGRTVVALFFGLLAQVIWLVVRYSPNIQLP